MQIKTKYDYTFTIMAKISKTNETKWWQDVEQVGLSYIAGGNI